MATDTKTTATLTRLLDDELRFSPSYRGYFSNHLAMAMIALDQLGASPDVLQAVFDEHEQGRPEYRDDGDVLEDRLFEIARDGIAATVRHRIATLVDGPATALFHPMIRLAYALDVGHEGQVAAALLDWERRYDVLPTPPPVPGERRLPEMAKELAAQPAGTWSHTFDLHGIARRPELREALTGLALDEHTLDDVSSFAVAAHLVADDFLTLHLVTGARAARAVTEWVKPDQAVQLAAAMVPALAVGYAAVGAPPLLDATELDTLRQSTMPRREEVVGRARNARDAHVIKLANVALVEEDRTSDPLYRYAAAHVVGLLPAASEIIRRSMVT